MKITERSTLNYFGRSTLSADEKKVVWHCKSLKMEFTREYSYADLLPEPKRMRIGVPNAANCATFLFIFNVVIFLVVPRIIPELTLLVLTLFAIPAYVFCLQFKKHDEAFFYTLKDEMAFSFDEGKHPEFLKFINEKISNQSSEPT